MDARKTLGRRAGLFFEQVEFIGNEREPGSGRLMEQEETMERDSNALHL